MSIYYMLNKPRGYITARRDEKRRVVMDLFPEKMRDVLHPVGRLDMDTEGLLIVTDDGMLDNALSQPKRHVEKKYFFHAIGKVSEDAEKMLESGIEIFGTGIIARPARFERLGMTTVKAIEKYLPAQCARRYMMNPDGDVTTACLTISEGRKHQVKLMMRSAGCLVVYLKRIAVGEITLDESLAPGEYREMTGDEIAYLQRYKDAVAAYWDAKRHEKCSINL